MQIKERRDSQHYRWQKNLFGYRDHSFFYLPATTGQQTNHNMKMFSWTAQREVSGKTPTANWQRPCCCQQIKSVVETLQWLSRHHQNEKPPKQKENTGQQIIDAENFLFHLSEQHSFDEDLNQLTHKTPIQKRSRFFHLTASVDEDVIVCSASRLANAPVLRATKKPIISDGRNKISCLFLEFQHNINVHVGVEQQTHSNRLDCCVLQYKTLMKKISNRCYDWRRQRQLNSQPQMSDLPGWDSQSNLQPSKKSE